MIFTGGFLGEPPVEIHDNRLWKLIFIDGF